MQLFSRLLNHLNSFKQIGLQKQYATSTVVLLSLPRVRSATIVHHDVTCTAQGLGGQ